MVSYPMIANFTGNKKSDDYATPAHAWKDIEHFIPKDKVIYMPFYYDGSAKERMEALNVKWVIHSDVDYFKNNFEYDLVIDNPPFSKKREILQKLKEDDKPFILLLPTATICMQYFQNLFRQDNIQLIIPKKRIHFEVDGEAPKAGAYFDCFYYCYKMELDKDINFI